MSLQTWQKNLLRITAFLLVLLMLVLAVGHYLMPQSNRYLEGYTAGGILGEDFDTIDVLVLGDSNAAQGIAPMKWYDEYGITGYTYAAGWMSMYNLYYRLKQIYEEQNPRVVVLCTAPAYSKKSSESTMQSALGDIADELLPLLRFHDNWKYLRPDNLQGSFEDALGHSDASYTQAVDSGAYTGFATDSAGYGLAQWTASDRKESLLAYAKEQGKSIGDLDMQLDFLYHELETKFPDVLAQLKNATSVRAASDSVLLHFEMPKDQSASVQAERALFGSTYYERYR